MSPLGIHTVPYPLVYMCIPVQNSIGMKTLKRQIGLGTSSNIASNITETIPYLNRTDEVCGVRTSNTHATLHTHAHV